MFFKKKSYFSEIVFTNEFYIDGVDVFNNNHRVVVKKVEIKLPIKLSYSKLSDSTLYKIIGLNSRFKIAISKFRDFHIISYVTARDFLRAHKYDVTKESNKINLELKFMVVAELLSKDSKDNCTFYSEDYRRKATIENVLNSFKVTYYTLLIVDECNFHFHENINKQNFYGWEDEGTTSFYDTYDNASQNVRLNLNDNSRIKDYHGYQINS